MKCFEMISGCVKLGVLLLQNVKVLFELVNNLLWKCDVQKVIDIVYCYCGQKELVIFCDQIMFMGFKEVFKVGILFGKDDMVIFDDKWGIVDDICDQVKDFE